MVIVTITMFNSRAKTDWLIGRSRFLPGYFIQRIGRHTQRSRVHSIHLTYKDALQEFRICAGELKYIQSRENRWFGDNQRVSSAA